MIALLALGCDPAQTGASESSPTGTASAANAADANTGTEPAAALPDPALDAQGSELLALAEQAMSASRPDDVADLLGSLLERDPAPSRALFVAGWAAYQLLRYEDAVELMGRALAQDPGLLANSRVLGFAHHKLGEFEQAVQLFERITRAAPEEYRAWYGLGLTELSLGRHGVARTHLERCLRDQPEYLKGRYTLGRLFEELGQPEAALPHVTFVLETEPSHVEALYLLSRVHSALGQPAEAEATVARWRLAYAVRERIGPLQQQVVEGQAIPELFLEMARQYALLDDLVNQSRVLRDGLRRFPQHGGLQLAWRSLDR
jgi:tetratricopeptide (TPR) repeat protein